MQSILALTVRNLRSSAQLCGGFALRKYMDLHTQPAMKQQHYMIETERCRTTEQTWGFLWERCK